MHLGAPTIIKNSDFSRSREVLELDYHDSAQHLFTNYGTSSTRQLLSPGFIIRHHCCVETSAQALTYIECAETLGRIHVTSNYENYYDLLHIHVVE